MKSLSSANRWKYAAGTLFILLPLCVLSTVGFSADDNAEKIENTRATIEKWVETQKTISKEKSDLAVAKELLNERIDLVQRDIASFQTRISEAQASIAETDKKRDEMASENEKLKDASQSLEKVLVKLENETRKLLQRLPEPIQERVKPLSQRLSKSSSDNKMTISERFQNVVGILNEVDKFNCEISLTSEVRTLGDGSLVEVTTMYVGIGQAYYANSNGDVAGIGYASDDGWVWKEANESAKEISDAIAILKNEQVASFVKLPVEIK